MRIYKIYSAFLLGVIATAILFLSLGSNFTQDNPITQVAKNQSSSEIRTLDQLLALKTDELNNVDIGLMNLLCAAGLKGSEDLNIDECLAKLDYWAEYAKKDLSQRISSFYRNPAKYDNSESLFKMVNLVLNLKLDMGVHYNLENVTHTDYTNSREIFIHGLLTGKHGGSCTSLPVLCAAVARRLGYPVKLAATSQHYFLRWEDPAKGERFNIEVSCEGVDTRTDDYYRNWPRKLDDMEILHGYLLKSLTPAEELAAFLQLRGSVLKDTGRIAEAQVAYANAYRLVPDKTVHLIDLAATVDQELERLAKNDYLAMGKKVKYTVCQSTEPDDMANAWVYRYPKTSEARYGPLKDEANTN